MSFLDKVIRAAVEGCLCKKVMHFIDRRIGMLSRHFLSKKLKVQHNKIMFMTYQNDYACNPKYIAEEIIRQGLPYEMIWAVKNPPKVKSKFPCKIKLVKRNSYEFYKEAMTSKIWIDNSINFFWEEVPKLKETIKFDTWHGSMGLKRVGKDDVKNPKWVKNARRCDIDTDFVISNSDFEDMVYKTTHWPTRSILKFGHPRNDILFEKDLNKINEIRKKVFNFLNIPKGAKIALYAPTFRDSHILNVYDLDYFKVLNALQLRFGGKWVILARHHFHLRNDRKAAQSIENIGNVIKATEYDDMQELMLVSDVGITDYSSWICDFILTQKPGFIFATDIDEYNNERGLYYPLETTPFPVAKNNEELLKNIVEFDDDAYLEQANLFLRDKGCVEDGKASYRVVERIKEIMTSKE